jgi:hypothetical protein
MLSTPSLTLFLEPIHKHSAFGQSNNDQLPTTFLHTLRTIHFVNSLFSIIIYCRSLHTRFNNLACLTIGAAGILEASIPN